MSNQTENGSAPVMPVKQERYLGIDLGTSTTYIMGWNENGFQDYTRIHPCAGDAEWDRNKRTIKRVNSNIGIPTIIAWSDELKENGEPVQWYVGFEAKRMILEREEKARKENREIEINENDKPYERELKQKLRNMAEDRINDDLTYETSGNGRNGKRADNSVREGELSRYATKIGNKNYSATKLTVKFLEEIFRKADDGFVSISQILTEIKGIVLGMPSISQNDDYKIYIRDRVMNPLIRNIVSRQIAKTISTYILEEPVLAGYAYLADNPTNDKEEKILVIDIGGGTTDFAIIHKDENNAIRLVAPSGGGGNPAGKTFDSALENAIRKAMGEEKAALNRLTPDDFRRAKENLFTSRKRSSTNASSKRFHVLENKNGEEDNSILIAYTEADYDFSEKETSKVRFSVTYAPACKDIYWHFIAALKSYLEQNKEHEYDKVLFVGGTSNIRELRTIVCSRCLGLIPGDKEEYYKSGQSYTSQLLGGKQVCVVFENDENQPSKADEIKRTSVNAVAYGATLAAKNGFKDYSVYDTYITFDQARSSEAHLIYSWKIHKEFEESRKMENVVFLRLMDDSFIKTHRDGNKYVYFRVERHFPGGRVSKFPRRGSYRENVRNAKICSEKEHSILYFICHPETETGNLMIYRFLATPDETGQEIKYQMNKNCSYNFGRIQGVNDVGCNEMNSVEVYCKSKRNDKKKNIQDLFLVVEENMKEEGSETV